MLAVTPHQLKIIFVCLFILLKIHQINIAVSKKFPWARRIKSVTRCTGTCFCQKDYSLRRLDSKLFSFRIHDHMQISFAFWAAVTNFIKVIANPAFCSFWQWKFCSLKNSMRHLPFNFMPESLFLVCFLFLLHCFFCLKCRLYHIFIGNTLSCMIKTKILRGIFRFNIDSCKHMPEKSIQLLRIFFHTKSLDRSPFSKCIQDHIDHIPYCCLIGIFDLIFFDRQIYNIFRHFSAVKMKKQGAHFPL